jgi:hypothetical protein
MTIDPHAPIYLVVVGHTKGPYIPETDFDRTSLVQVCKDLKAGQYEDIVAVLECNVRDVTNACKDLLPKD